MENDPREQQRRSYTLMRMIYDIGVASLILIIGIALLIGDKLHTPALANLVANMDPMIRYLFGGLCVLYGGFRLYRGIKHQY